MAFLVLEELGKAGHRKPSGPLRLLQLCHTAPVQPLSTAICMEVERMTVLLLHAAPLLSDDSDNGVDTRKILRRIENLMLVEYLIHQHL